MIHLAEPLLANIRTHRLCILMTALCVFTSGCGVAAYNIGLDQAPRGHIEHSFGLQSQPAGVSVFQKKDGQRTHVCTTPCVLTSTLHTIRPSAKPKQFFLFGIVADTGLAAASTTLIRSGSLSEFILPLAMFGTVAAEVIVRSKMPSLSEQTLEEGNAEQEFYLHTFDGQWFRVTISPHAILQGHTLFFDLHTLQPIPYTEVPPSAPPS